MSEIRILRRGRVNAATVGTTTSSSSTVRVDDMTAGVLYVASAATSATTISVWAAEAPDGVYLPLQDAAGGDVEIALNTAADCAYTLPAAVGSARFIRLVADSDIGTAATVSVSVKS